MGGQNHLEDLKNNPQTSLYSMTVEYIKKRYADQNGKPYIQMAIFKGYHSDTQCSSLAIMNSPDGLAITYDFIS